MDTSSDPAAEQPQNVELFQPSKTEWMIASAVKAWNLSAKDAKNELAKLSPMTRDEFADWLASKS